MYEAHWPFIGLGMATLAVLMTVVRDHLSAPRGDEWRRQFRRPR